MHKIAVASRKGVEDAGGTYEAHPAEAVVEKMIEIGRPSRLKGAGFYEYADGKRVGLWSGLKETFNSGVEVRRREGVSEPQRPARQVAQEPRLPSPEERGRARGGLPPGERLVQEVGQSEEVPVLTMEGEGVRIRKKGKNSPAGDAPGQRLGGGSPRQHLFPQRHTPSGA